MQKCFEARLKTLLESKPFTLLMSELVLYNSSLTQMLMTVVTQFTFSRTIKNNLYILDSLT